MAILQALISFLGRSLRRVVNALFGWAVVALFGRRSPREHLVLTVVVAMAALWPLLLVGVAFPKVAALVLAFLPVFDEDATWPLRMIWIGLAVLVPAVVSIAMATKAPPGAPRASLLNRALRAIPVTLGIAMAFLLMLVIVPVLRIASFVRGRKDEHVPLMTDDDEYEGAAREIDRLLAGHGLDAWRAPPAWWLAAPAKALETLCGKALRGYMPARLAYWRGPALELALYPSNVLLRGEKDKLASTHGLLEEAFARGPGLMTHDAAAQDIERQIQRIWRVYAENPRAHRGSKRLLARLDDVARDIRGLETDYEQWQVVYRKSLQLGRALLGQAPLLAAGSSAHEFANERETEMKNQSEGQRSLQGAPTRVLLKQAVGHVAELSKKQLELARCELRSDLRSEISMVKGLGVAGVCALTGLNMLLVALVFALADTMPEWLAAAGFSAVMLLVAGIAGAIGWAKRVRTPLEKTRKTLQQDVRWVKERLA
jgi:uncharacterized membrane protein YqjE